MKKLLTLLALVLGISANSQVYCTRYTHYSQVDTVSRQFMSDVAYNVKVCVDYIDNNIVIEDDNSIFVLNIIHETGTEEALQFETRNNLDKQIWKVSILALPTKYVCVVSKDNFTRIYKKQR